MNDDKPEFTPNSEHEEKKPPPLPGSADRLNRQNQTKRADEKFCPSCGKIIQLKTLSCPYCGKRQKSESMGCLPAAVIALVIGFFGIAFIGILAAVAIPQFAAYRVRADEADLRDELMEVCRLNYVYFNKKGEFTKNIQDLGHTMKRNVSIEIFRLENNCFYAKGEVRSSSKIYYIDCECIVTEVEKGDIK